MMIDLSIAQETYPQANNFDEMVDSALSAISSSSDNISVTETKNCILSLFEKIVMKYFASRVK